MAYQQQPAMSRFPNPQNKPVDALGQREWNNGFCGCCDDVGSCCLACWCPCMTYSITHSKLSALRQTGRPHPTGGDTCGGMAWAFCAVNYFGFAWVMAMLQRSEVRERYGIKGNGCGDCMAACCCFVCAQVQELREIEDEEKSLIGQQPQMHQQPQIGQQQGSYQGQQPQQQAYPQQQGQGPPQQQHYQDKPAY